MRYPSLLTLATLLLAAIPLYAEEPPISTFSAHYEVRVAGLKMGEMDRYLKKVEGDRYALGSVVYTTGLIAALRPDRFEEQSLWQWKKGAPIPERYTYHYTRGEEQQVHEQLDFDWQAMEVLSVRDGKSVKLPIESGTVDKLSYQIALVNELKHGKKEFSYQVADRGDIRNIRYKVVGEEMSETPWGELKTVVVERQTLTKERVTTLWCAPALGYSVVKLVQDDNGTKMSAYITALELDGKPYAAPATENGAIAGSSPPVILPND